jgi:signal transduction histidine kinase
MIRETPITFGIHKMPIRDEHKRVIGICGISRDITDRKKAEEERRMLQERLARSEKMESLGMLAGGVAHDLNNVLGILVGYSELLAEEIEPANPLRPHIEHIRQGGERAAAIVQDLLTMARRGVQTLEVVDLNAVIDDLQDTPEFEKICAFHPHAQLETLLAGGLLNIQGSPVHLSKTIVNLVSNAAEAMPAGGRITISTRNEYLDRPVSGYDEVREGDYVVLSVTDTGEGIAEADLTRIFEPFYTKKVMGRSGTGLGLAVVWGTVRDHKGYINVQSEPGKGTTFSLYFPVTREEIAKGPGVVSVSDYTGRGESILVVDDVQGQRELAARMLTKLNYSVATASSGEAAVEYIKTHEVDLVVLDMIMDPGIDGLETYRRIREIRPGQKAIIVSGFAETERVHKAQELGAGAYLKKPYLQERLGMAVREELRR